MKKIKRKYYYVEETSYGRYYLTPYDFFWSGYSRLRDAVRGFTRYVNANNLSGVVLVLPDKTQIIYE